MSGYHLCQVKKARHPYFIESISTNIFTIEELCFYLEKNIYLLDQTIINEKLLDWIRDELGLVRLYRKLYEQLENGGDDRKFYFADFQGDWLSPTMSSGSSRRRSARLRSSPRISGEK